MSMEIESATPLMKQFFQLKQQANSALLFFRMGDFYELFGDDAVTAAPILGITLTSRDKKAENPMPMAGVPYHSAQNYIQKLLNAGKKVAIAEQFLPEGVSADQIKGIVERRIVRTFTPAVQFELNSNTQQNFIATISPNDKSGEFTLALFEPATGVVKISEPMMTQDLLSSPAVSSIKHFLVSSPKTPTEILSYFENSKDVLMEEIASNLVSDAETKTFLQKQYDKQILHPLLENGSAKKALSLLLQYTLKTQQLDTFPHLHEPRALTELNRLILGPNTYSHLDLDDLFTLINQTATSMGARTLKQYLHAPFKELSEIHTQQEAAKELSKSVSAHKIHSELKEVYDLDRILGRIATKLANPRDTYALGRSLRFIFDVEEQISGFRSKMLQEVGAALKEAKESLLPITEKILKTQKAEAPLHTREAGIFEMGTDTELDRLITLSQNGERFLIDLETRERDLTGIQSLKVKYNRVFGYFIEISTANLAKVPSHYQRKQTMVGGERFFTEELKKFEEEILTASQKQRALEAELFQKLISELISLAQPLKDVSTAIAELDAVLSLSFLTQKNGWNFPLIDESKDFHLKGSRHPVVDAALHGKFVANDLEMSESTRTLVITGPNMGGKSTLMRQMAQIILLGQMGAPVPAREAKWGVFHSLYTRIGAQDAIAKGQSTFMVEMVELAHILNHADSRSFVVLDEIGRGTSTYDGMSVASSSLEYLHKKSNARIVFATHYHELTALEEKLPHLKNAHMTVSEETGKLTFLYELAPGKSSKSFGIQVAELAGLPKPVIKDAWKILKQLEIQGAQVTSESSQLSLFSTL